MDEIKTEETKEETTEEGIKIHKTEWSASELAMILGLKKEFDEETGIVTYGVTNENVLTSLVGHMITDHEKFKNARMGLTTPSGRILNPFGGNNGRR